MLNFIRHRWVSRSEYERVTAEYEQRIATMATMVEAAHAALEAVVASNTVKEDLLRTLAKMAELNFKPDKFG